MTQSPHSPEKRNNESINKNTHINDFATQKLPLHIATLSHVRAGKAMPFTREQLSAINKTPISEPTAVNYMGLVTDEQADRRHHGGHLKAVHQMPSATYDKLNQAFGLKTSIGLLGENLTTVPLPGYADLAESTVCIGDVFQYGDAEDAVQLRIVQPRRPCYKINDQIRMLSITSNRNKNIASWFTQQGIAGWYFEVVKEGVIRQDLPVYLIKRPYPFASLDKLWQLANSKQTIDTDVTQPWLAIDCLEESWKKVLSKKVLSKK